MSELEEKSRSAQTTEGKMFLHDLRMYMRDTKSLNTLLDEDEIEESSLILALRMSVSDYNSMAPLVSGGNFKDLLAKGLFSPLLQLTTSHVLEMKYQWQERNNLNYSDGGSSESVNDKAPSYKDTSVRLRNMAMESFKEFKLAQNIRRGYRGNTGLHSDYAYVNYSI